MVLYAFMNKIVVTIFKRCDWFLDVETEVIPDGGNPDWLYNQGEPVLCSVEEYGEPGFPNYSSIQGSDSVSRTFMLLQVKLASIDVLYQEYPMIVHKIYFKKTSKCGLLPKTLTVAFWRNNGLKFRYRCIILI